MHFLIELCIEIQTSTISQQTLKLCIEDILHIISYNFHNETNPTAINFEISSGNFSVFVMLLKYNFSSIKLYDIVRT